MDAPGWRQYLKGSSLDWLLEADPANPGPRYFAMRDLLDLPLDDPRLAGAREQVMLSGPVPAFLLSCDPVAANYPSPYTGKPNRSWFQFGYPIAYVTDMLQNVETLAGLGCTAHPQVQAALGFILGKQDSSGRWAMEYTYNGKTWVDIEQKGKPSKWVTLRALRAVKKLAPSTSV